MTSESEPVDTPTVEAAPPVAPVVTLGRAASFLEVSHTVRVAEAFVDHLDGEGGDPEAGACDHYDGVARPLRAVTGADGLVVLELAGGEAQPELVRERTDAFLRWAMDRLEAGGELGDLHREDLEPLPEEFSFARFLDTLDQRFNPPLKHDHVGSRLHNFWHAIAG